MPDSERSEPPSIDLRRDAEHDSEAQVDVAVYTAAKFYGPVALPLHVSFAQAAAIESKANMAQQLDGADAFITGGNGASFDQLMPEQRRKKADEEALAFMTAFADEAERREAREREEWAHTRATAGGVTMTGAEWANFAKRLREDDDLRQRVIEAFKKRGLSDAEAERRYERVADVAEIAAIPESQRTEAQTATFEKAKADPTFKQDMATVKEKLDRKAEAAPSASPRNESDIVAADRNREPQPPATTAPAPRPVTIATGPGF